MQVIISSVTRNSVFNRDGNKCRKCGSQDRLTIDHIVPLSLGGDSEESNLQTLCNNCNFAKGSTHPIRLKDRIKYIWRSYERGLSLRDLILVEVQKFLKRKIDVKEVEAMFQSRTDKMKNEVNSSLLGEVAKLENKANDKLKAILEDKKVANLKMAELENRIIILEKKKPMGTKIKIIATEVRAGDLIAGNLFSLKGQDFWNEIDNFNSHGEKVYIKNNHVVEEHADELVYKITIQRYE